MMIFLAFAVPAVALAAFGWIFAFLLPNPPKDAELEKDVADLRKPWMPNVETNVSPDRI